MYFRNMEFAYDTVYLTDHAGPDDTSVTGV